MDEQYVSTQNRNRFSLLRCLYQTSGGDIQAIVPLQALAAEAGLDHEQARLAADYLVGEGLLQYRTFGPTVSITHEGVVQVERAIAAPDKPTDFFPPLNVIYIGSMTQSQIQQGTVASTQTATFSSADMEAIGDFIARLKEGLPRLSLPPAAVEEINSEITTLEAQSRSPRPKSTIIREALTSIRTILETAAGDALAILLLQQLPRVM